MVVGVDEHQSGLVLTRRQQVLLCLAESPVGVLRTGDVDLMLAASRWRAAGILVQGGLQRAGFQFQGPPGLADQVRKLDFSTRRTNGHGSIVATRVFRRKSISRHDAQTAHPADLRVHRLKVIPWTAPDS